MHIFIWCICTLHIYGLHKYRRTSQRWIPSLFHVVQYITGFLCMFLMYMYYIMYSDVVQFISRYCNQGSSWWEYTIQIQEWPNKHLWWRTSGAVVSFCVEHKLFVLCMIICHHYKLFWGQVHEQQFLVLTTAALKQ